METGRVIFVIFILVIILALLLTVYSFKDKVFNSLSFEGGFFNIGFDSYIFNPGFSSSQIDKVTEDASSIFNANGNYFKVSQNRSVPEGLAEEDLSPYYGRFKLSASRGGVSVINLSVKLDEGERVIMNNWKIKTSSEIMKMPKAIEYYVPPSGGPEYDIILKPGNHSIKIYASVSAIGKNFRENKCSGYLTNGINFTPRIGGQCASISKNEYRHLSGSCRNLLDSYNNSCRNPLNEARLNFPPDSYCNGLLDKSYCYSDYSDCRDFFDQFNYSACYDRTKDQADFLGDEWHLWIGKNILSPTHDEVYIYDENYKLVAEYIY